MKDYSRMFGDKPAAAVEGEKMANFSNMFSNSPTKAKTSVVEQKSPFNSSADILNWRRDLSDKVKEHVDLIDKLVQQDCNLVALAEEKLHEMSNKVISHMEDSESKGFFSFLKAKNPTVDMAEVVRKTTEEISNSLSPAKKSDPFKLLEVDRMVEQATYLAEQLAKAGEELDKKKPQCVDDIEIDSINRRCTTLYTQQQLVAIGAEQVRKLAADIRSRPHQVDDLLNATIPMYRKLCLDVLSGAKQIFDLRKVL